VIFRSFQLTRGFKVQYFWRYFRFSKTAWSGKASSFGSPPEKKWFFIQINKCKFNTYNKREILERFSHHSYAAWSPLTFKIFIKRVFNPSFHYARFPWTCKRCKHIHDTKYDQWEIVLKKIGFKTTWLWRNLVTVRPHTKLHLQWRKP